MSPASVGDRDGAAVLFARAADAFPRLRHVWADQGYRGADFYASAREATGITVQVVQRRERRRIPLDLGEGGGTASGSTEASPGVWTRGFMPRA